MEAITGCPAGTMSAVHEKPVLGPGAGAGARASLDAFTPSVQVRLQSSAAATHGSAALRNNAFTAQSRAEGAAAGARARMVRERRVRHGRRRTRRGDELRRVGHPRNSRSFGQRRAGRGGRHARHARVEVGAAEEAGVAEAQGEGEAQGEARLEGQGEEALGESGGQEARGQARGQAQGQAGGQARGQARVEAQGEARLEGQGEEALGESGGQEARRRQSADHRPDAPREGQARGSKDEARRRRFFSTLARVPVRPAERKGPVEAAAVPQGAGAAQRTSGPGRRRPREALLRKASEGRDEAEDQERHCSFQVALRDEERGGAAAGSGRRPVEGVGITFRCGVAGAAGVRFGRPRAAAIDARPGADGGEGCVRIGWGGCKHLRLG